MSAPKIYDPKEEKLNVLTHLAGVVCAPFALAGLLSYAQGPVPCFACILYILSMAAMFSGSCLYHAAKDPQKRAFLRKIDHSSIYFLISGTYTPVMLLCVPGPAGVLILGLSWLIAAAGITSELLDIRPFKGFSLTMYLFSGWLCVAVLGTLIRNLSSTELILLAAGGLAYSLGVVFYVSRRLYSHAVWHLFVIGGVVLHYLVVLSRLKS